MPNGTYSQSLATDYPLFQRNVMDPFERYLSEGLAPNPKTEPLITAMTYSLLAGGKRLRPSLCLATAALFGADPIQTFPVAAAIECIHTYSLVHDDLPCMDDDDLRRGRPTNHKVYGEAMALLAGDALLTYAFEWLSQVAAPATTVVNMVRCLAKAAGPSGMVGGQVCDMNHGDATLERLQFIHQHKTGRLIEASIELGAHMAGVADSTKASLQAFGQHIGHAFQVMDDWLDVYGTTEELGKPVGSDQEMNKLTYPALVGPDETLRIAETEYSQAIAALSPILPDDSLLHVLAQKMVRRRK